MQLKTLFASRLLLVCWLLTMTGMARADPLNVLVSILPQQYFAEQIGGKHVQVTVLVGPGRSPENYEPTLQQMTQLGRAKLFWRMGLPFEDVLAQRIMADRTDTRVLDSRTGVQLRQMEDLAMVLAAEGEGSSHHHEEDEEEHAHEHQGADPHFWLSPRIVKQLGGRFKDALVDIDPVHAADYEANFRQFAAQLDQLDQEISQLLAGIEHRRFMVFHPAWGYFADDYGLRQIPIEIEGKSPGPKTLAAVIQLARREQIKVIFVQRQFSQRDANTVAQAIGGAVVAMDPLALDYVDNLRLVAQTFAAAM